MVSNDTYQSLLGGHKMNAEEAFEQTTQINMQINTILNEELRNFVKSILDKVPEKFWTIPASSSGKHHPEQSNGEGGLVRHILATLYFAREFCIVYSASEDEQDIVKASLLLHDIGKAIAEPHDIVGAQVLRWADKTSNPLIQATIAGVRWHMGPWSTGSTLCHKDERGFRSFPEGFTRVEQIVHLSDYAASRKRVNLTKLGV